MRLFASYRSTSLRVIGAAALLASRVQVFAVAAQEPASSQPANPATHVPEKDWPALQKQQVWADERVARSPRHGEWVDIQSGNRKVHAWLEYPAGKAKAGVVLVLHEAFGITHSTRLTADEVAAMGYIAIAPDMVSGLGPNGGNADSFTGNGAVTQALVHRTDADINADLNALMDYSEQLQRSNGRIAMVGLSWGGGAAFRYAAENQRKDLKGVFLFYDVAPPRQTQKLDTASVPIPMDKIDVPVYGFYPTLDMRVMNGLPPTKNAMEAAHKSFDTVIYQDADHGYIRIAEDPSNNNPEDVKAFQDSMNRLRVTLKKLLQ